MRSSILDATNPAAIRGVASDAAGGAGFTPAGGEADVSTFCLMILVFRAIKSL